MVVVGPETAGTVLRGVLVVDVAVVVDVGATVVVVDDGDEVLVDAPTAAAWVVPAPQALRPAAAVPVSNARPASTRRDAMAA